MNFTSFHQKIPLLLFKRMNGERIEICRQSWILFPNDIHNEIPPCVRLASGDVDGFNYVNDGDGDDDGDGDRIPPPGKDVPRSRENGTARRPPWACASSLYSL